MKDEYGTVSYFVGFYTDMTGIKKAEQRLQHLVNHDSLTDLPNRLLFVDRLKMALDRAVRYEKTVAVLFVDLDCFKQVNDTFGHNAGDDLLIQFSLRLK